MRRGTVFASAIAIIFLIFAVAAVEVPAQSGDVNVHITPRVAKNTAPDPNVLTDPTLKTHTKPLRSDVELVLVPVTVTDNYDRLVTGLEKNNFEVYEDKDKQEIRHISSEDTPISLGIIFDLSGSMSNKLEKSKEAVVQFMQTANPEDEFFIIVFNDRPELLADFTDSVGDIQSRLVTAVPKGMTALLDAIYLGLNEMKHARHRRKALLIISDGGDNHSRYSEREIKSTVKEADVQVFAIGLFDETPHTTEERFGPLLLSDLTNLTGGRTFTIGNPNELPDVAAKIGTQLRNQYVLAYAPAKKARDGKWHKIRVKLMPPKGLPSLSVYTRQGYYAAAQ